MLLAGDPFPWILPLEKNPPSRDTSMPETLNLFYTAWPMVKPPASSLASKCQWKLWRSSVFRPLNSSFARCGSSHERHRPPKTPRGRLGGRYSRYPLQKDRRGPHPWGYIADSALAQEWLHWHWRLAKALTRCTGWNLQLVCFIADYLLTLSF